MDKYIFGVDIGGTTVKIGLFTDRGELLSDYEIKTRKQDKGKNILPDIKKSIFEKAKEENIIKENIIGVGLTAPGVVQKDGVILRAVNLGWGRFNIKEEFAALTGLRVEVANDANAAALGEIWKGGGKGFSDIMLVTLGTGVGGGLIINGKIHEGAHGAATEIGHFPLVDPEDEQETCGCGKRGCFEQYTSANGAVRVAKRYLKSHPEATSRLRDIPDFTSKDIFDLVKKKEETACEIAEIVYRYLGKGLAIISSIVDVEAFIIGGGMAKAGQVLVDGIKKYYDIYTYYATRNALFRLATLGNKAGIYGAAKLIIG